MAAVNQASGDMAASVVGETIGEERQQQTAMAPAGIAAPPVGERWGDPISAERQAELKALAERQRAWSAQPAATRGDSAFKDVRLTGAEVFWLVQEYGRGDGEYGSAPNLHLEGAVLEEAHLAGALLTGAHLQGARLSRAHLERAWLDIVQLEGANLEFAHLEGASLYRAHLEGASLYQVHLEGAHASEAHLERAYLDRAHLEGADLGGAYVQEADLSGAHLEGTDLSGAHLEGAKLCGAWLDSKAVLSRAAITNTTQLGDIHWSGVGAVNLTQVDWTRVTRLGDETTLQRGATADQNEAAVRAYRQVVAQLRAQGLNEHADRFAYRAQLCQRVVLRRQRKVGAYVFSLFLAALTGYGYRLERIFIAYLVAIFGFAAMFLAGQALQAHSIGTQDILNAIVDSLKAFHQRGFDTIFTPRGAVTFAEAVVGLVIESTFVAMLVQRLRAGSGG